MKASVVNEITIYLSNQAGQLGHITQELSDNKVSIMGLLVSEGFGKSVVRVVVDQEDKALEILKGAGIDEVSLSPVLAVQMPSKVGVISDLSKMLGSAGINIDNMYVTESTSGDTIAYMSVADIDEALAVFE